MPSWKAPRKIRGTFYIYKCTLGNFLENSSEGEVVFSSISIERNTGKSKGCGIVQYETTEMAQRAIQIMRNHPIGDQPLYVRPDYQEESQRNTNHSRDTTRSNQSKLRQSSRPRNVWRYCFDNDEEKT